MSLNLLIKNLNVSNLDKNFTRQIDSISTSTIIESVINDLSKNLNLNSEKLELSYCGEILKRNKSINDYLMNNSDKACFFLTEKRTISIQKGVPSSAEVATLVNLANSVFRSKTRRYHLEKILQNYNKFDEILKSFPEIKNEPIAYNFVQSFDLLKSLCDAKKADSYLQSYPNVYYGAKLILEYVKDTAVRVQTSEDNSNQFVARSSFTIDEMSEEEDANQQPGMMPQMNQRRPVPSITQDQLSAVLASLNQQMLGAPRQPNAQSSQSPQSQQAPVQPAAPASTGGLDRNYLQNVMQQLMGGQNPAVSNPSTSASQPTIAPPTRSALSDEDLATKLEQMHELGFFNDELNLRALEITEGNVEAAISFLIEGGEQ